MTRWLDPALAACALAGAVYCVRRAWIGAGRILADALDLGDDNPPGDDGPPSTVEPPPAPEPDPVVHTGVDEVAGMDGYLADPTQPPIARRPLRPPSGSDAWWRMRFGKDRVADRVRARDAWRRIDDAQPGWAALLAAAEAEDAEFWHIVQSASEDTAEWPIVQVGAR